MAVRGWLLPYPGGNDLAVWDYLENPGVYWGIPYEAAIGTEGAPPLPVHQDGRTIIRTDTGVTSTRQYLGSGPLGPITADQLMAELRHASEYGSWSITGGKLLGRYVQIIEIRVERVRQDSHGMPYTKRLWLDPLYMFVLAIEQSGGLRDYEARMTELSFNEPIPDSVFVFEAPAGAKNCLPPQFQIPPDCPRSSRP